MKTKVIENAIKALLILGIITLLCIAAIVVFKLVCAFFSTEPLTVGQVLKISLAVYLLRKVVSAALKNEKANARTRELMKEEPCHEETV